jgi:hypothetical protein
VLDTEDDYDDVMESNPGNPANHQVGWEGGRGEGISKNERKSLHCNYKIISTRIEAAFRQNKICRKFIGRIF